MVQQIIVFLVFAVALGYLGRRSWLALRRPQAGGCAKGCGCDTPSNVSVSARQKA